LLIVLPGLLALSQPCFECHDVAGLEATDPLTGRHLDLHIPKAGYKASVHGELECAVCHAPGYDQIPHNSHRRRDAFACLYCHKGDGVHLKRHFLARQREVLDSMHRKELGREFDCLSCHDPHRFRAEKAPLEERNDRCLTCHRGDGKGAPFDAKKDTRTRHGFLPSPALHLKDIACVDCHSRETQLRHEVLELKHSLRDCRACHSAEQARVARRGDAYVIGSARFETLDRLSLGFLALLGLGILAHALTRIALSGRRKP
jgi:predicted CXXCH cytochrome family protein